MSVRLRHCLWRQRLWRQTARAGFSVSSAARGGGSHDSHGGATNHYKLAVVGFGTGGAAIAHKMVRSPLLGGVGTGHVCVVEPSDRHYYQPMFTLVGVGAKTFEQTHRPMVTVIPKAMHWFQEAAAEFWPDNNQLLLNSGRIISYDCLVVAMGLQLDYGKIKGLPDALETDPSVCSNYSPKYVQKTLKAIQKFDGGNMIFTFPNTPVKCAGAPQKAMYLTDHYLRRWKRRHLAKITYCSSLGVIFGVPKYAEALNEVVRQREIEVKFKRNLIEVDPSKKEAVFECLDAEVDPAQPRPTETLPYDFIHVAPPMSVPDVLKKSVLVDETGFVEVNKFTLQHERFPNVFAIGDCVTMPSTKTAAACCSQSRVLFKSIRAVMKQKTPKPLYKGYTSCPLTTEVDKCILAEFGYDGPMETFPFNQAKERTSMYKLKADLMPMLYWHGLIKGRWNGPEQFRRLTNPLSS